MSTPSTWPDLLDRIEASIADAECGALPHDVDLGVADRLGGLPPELRGRAEALAGRAARLEERLAARLAELDSELGRHPARRRAWQPPAPSHLDHLA